MTRFFFQFIIAAVCFCFFTIYYLFSKLQCYCTNCGQMMVSLFLDHIRRQPSHTLNMKKNTHSKVMANSIYFVLVFRVDSTWSKQKAFELDQQRQLVGFFSCSPSHKSSTNQNHFMSFSILKWSFSYFFFLIFGIRSITKKINRKSNGFTFNLLLLFLLLPFQCRQTMRNSLHYNQRTQYVPQIFLYVTQ